ncbi:MAG: SpoIIE family protein phosphatase [Bacteroidota bacterium]|nr:SpoIIE family protein phosphatase [Candidatus Kapabacteria bacterium]MDW8218963.1 SpoIIE family protein phosphatase [Bacteroidota bacterium]
MLSSTTLINLQSLIDLSAALNSSDDESFIFNTALLSVMGKLRTVKACALVPVFTSNLSIWRCIVAKGIILPNEPLEIPVQFQNNGHITIHHDVITSAGIELCQAVCISINDMQPQCIGLLCFGANITQQPYTEEEYQYTSLVSSITANAVLNARNLRALRETGIYLERKNQLLTTLFEINREFTALLRKEDILKFLSLHLMGQLAVSKFAVLIKNLRNSASFEVSINRMNITLEDVERLSAAYYSNPHVLEECSHIIHDCAVAVPMKTQNEVKGLLLVGPRMNGRPFTTEERNFLEALGGIAMIALENARLFHEELEKKRLEDELNLARTIQQGLLPQQLPTIAEFDIMGISISSKQIGGDYYDVISLGNDEWLLVIADVSGKGTPAALLMANIQAALRALAPINLPLSSLVNRINTLLVANTSADKFITLFCAKLNARNHTLTFCNAGHNPPLVRRANGTIERLSEGGLILGVMEAVIPYEERTIFLDKGDILVCYTDGVSEALNEHYEEFTEQRLEAVLHTYSDQSAQTLISAVVEEVQRHAGKQPQSDDITMLVLCCTEHASCTKSATKI